jgi:hypothetical protein
MKSRSYLYAALTTTLNIVLYALTFGHLKEEFAEAFLETGLDNSATVRKDSPSQSPKKK